MSTCLIFLILGIHFPFYPSSTFAYTWGYRTGERPIRFPTDCLSSLESLPANFDSSRIYSYLNLQYFVCKRNKKAPSEHNKLKEKKRVVYLLQDSPVTWDNELYMVDTIYIRRVLSWQTRRAREGICVMHYSLAEGIASTDHGLEARKSWRRIDSPFDCCCSCGWIYPLLYPPVLL